jgi:hypothetical protein
MKVDSDFEVFHVAKAARCLLDRLDFGVDSLGGKLNCLGSDQGNSLKGLSMIKKKGNI